MGEPADSISEAEETDSRVGLVVAGSYQIVSRLGAGSMGDVYEAEHLRLGNRVAIKFPRARPSTDLRAVKRFRREASALAALRSDYIVTIFDCGELDDGMPYLVMERLHGEDLKSLLERNGPLPVRRAVRIMLGACRGLAVVHAAGLVHRDLKPANLFVVREGNGSERCKILDFGVAKTLASDATRPGVVVGTVRYMPPEQLENSAAASPAADSYALGAILYECLTGRPAHRGETLEELMFDILQRDPSKPSMHRPVPPELDEIVLRALSRTAAKRFASAEQLASALEAFDRSVPSVRGGASSDETSGDGSLLETALPKATRAPVRYVWLVAIAFAAGFFSAWLPRGGRNASHEVVRPPYRALVAPVTANASPLRPGESARLPPPASVAPPNATTTQVGDAGKGRAPVRPVTRPSPPRSSSSEADRFDRLNPYADP